MSDTQPLIGLTAMTLTNPVTGSAVLVALTTAQTEDTHGPNGYMVTTGAQTRYARHPDEAIAMAMEGLGFAKPTPANSTMVETLMYRMRYGDEA
jgi:hypothetical protein